MKRPLRKNSTDRKAAAYIWAIALSGEILSLINHRLFWRVCHGLSERMPEGRYTAELVLDSDCNMKIRLDDPYWLKLVASSFSYEQEILHVLEKLKHAPYTFIDCGANIGYWSIMVSGERLGAHKALAIEASPENFEVLEENWALNGKRFKCANVALFSVSGQRVTITTGSSGHHSSHKIARQNTEGMRNEGVALTATLDDVVKEHFGEIPDRLVVKLDIEGAEIDALRGAPDLLERDVLFCYEDNTRDLKSGTSRYLLEELELAVFIPTKDGKLLRVRNIEEATRYMNSWRIGGYRSSGPRNFFACKEQSRFLEEYLPRFSTVL